MLDQQVSARDHTVVKGECRSELFDRDLVVDLTRSSQKRFVEPSSSDQRWRNLIAARFKCTFRDGGELGRRKMQF